ncbi:hypothetical protein BV898_06193 [Hypsibius exemplaris]|uniref:Uncharacterized protein n=1 Tax=Hypsibius exemplaris TaxID=2072580 RepID=A0A1W0WXN4_HYPEX|nr:hypothetical protein BV898_06193 [Hypsibius exemplaris]
MKIYHGILVPTSVFTLWNCIGLLPYPVRTDRASPTHRIVKWVLRIWTILILLLYCYFYAIEIIIFTRTYHAELIDLEFFTLVLAIYREYAFVLPIVVLLILFIKRRTVPRLVIAVEASVADILDMAQIKFVRQFHHISLVVILMIAAGSAYCSYAGFDLMISEMRILNPNASWSSRQPLFIVPGKALSYRAVGGIYGSALSYTTLCWSIPAILIVGLVLAIGYGFANIRRELRTLSNESYVKCGCIFEVCQRIARLRHDHRRLRSAVNEINTSVAFIIILSTLGDIIMPVSLISKILQEESKDLQSNFQNECQKYGVYFFSICAILQGMLRIFIFVWMHEQATRAKAHLHDIGLHAVDEAIRDDARSFEQELVENEDEMAVSGNGFFSMTKLFAATLFGINLTYFLLIYQQKDQKGDLDKVSQAQAAAFRRLAAQIESLSQRLNETLRECSVR